MLEHSLVERSNTLAHLSLSACGVRTVSATCGFAFAADDAVDAVRELLLALRSMSFGDVGFFEGVAEFFESDVVGRLEVLGVLSLLDGELSFGVREVKMLDGLCAVRVV